LCSKIAAQDIEQIAKNKAFDYYGNINLNAGYNAYFGNATYRQPLVWGITGALGARVYGFDIPIAFSIVRQERRIQYPQFNFNQFGITPNYRWLKIYAGHSNMTFSPYTLGGHTFLGGGLELTPKKFRFAAMYGRMLKAVKEDTLSNFATFPTYRRIGFGAKIGVGSATNFFDLMFFKGKDEANSIPQLKNFNIKPAENVVIGVSSRFLIKKVVHLDLDLAGSIYTRDTRLKTIVSDTSLKLLSKTESIIPIRYSTQFSTAGKGAIGYIGKRFSLQGNYERIDPEYSSMGCFFFNNDLENYTIAPSLNLTKVHLRVSGSYGIQRNNLLKNKELRTNRSIGSINLAYQPNDKFGIDANYTNYSLNQQSGRVLLNDTIRIANVNRNLSITPRYTLLNEQKVQTFIAVFNQQGLTDRNPFNQESNEVNTTFVSLIYASTLVKKNQNLNLGLTYLTTKTVQANINSIGFSTGFSKSLKENKMTFSCNEAFSKNTFNGKNNGFNNSINFNISYQLNASQRLSFDCNYLTYNTIAQPKFSELRLVANYGMALMPKKKKLDKK
jgi:hypothetical protein